MDIDEKVIKPIKSPNVDNKNSPSLLFNPTWTWLLL